MFHCLCSELGIRKQSCGFISCIRIDPFEFQESLQVRFSVPVSAGVQLRLCKKIKTIGEKFRIDGNRFLEICNGLLVAVCNLVKIGKPQRSLNKTRIKLQCL